MVLERVRRLVQLLVRLGEWEEPGDPAEAVRVLGERYSELSAEARRLRILTPDGRVIEVERGLVRPWSPSFGRRESPEGEGILVEGPPEHVGDTVMFFSLPDDPTEELEELERLAREDPERAKRILEEASELSPFPAGP